MSNELALVERSFDHYLPTFADVLRPTGLPAERIIRTVLIACEKNPKLIAANRQSLINSAMTAAVLGLEVDGVTGQGFLIPYNLRDQGLVAQFQLGYKGIATIAARAQLTINCGVFREGDVIDYAEGTSGFVHHKRKLAGKEGRKILGAWSTAEANGRPPIVAVMSYDDILAIKAKSPGAKKQDSPWNDINGPGHEAMCAKTAVRRCGRLIPLSVIQRAVTLEDHQDMGQAAYLRPDGALTISGTVEDGYVERQPEGDGAPVNLDPPFKWTLGNGEIKGFHTAMDWENFIIFGLGRASSEQAASARERNTNFLSTCPDIAAASRVIAALDEKLAT